MRAWKELVKGIWRENPTLVMVLGLCPTLAITTSLQNAVGMGAAVTFVLVCSNVLISLLRRWLPHEVRIPCYIVIIASFVTVVDLSMQAWLPSLSQSLGVFVPLIVANCIPLARAECFACKNGPVVSFFDGLGMGLGVTLALSLVSIPREVIGTGCLWGIPFGRGLDVYALKIFVIPPGGFLVVAFVLGGIKLMTLRREKREQLKAVREASEDNPANITLQNQ